MAQKTLIFDFDGTLADTFPLVVEVSYQLSGAKRLKKTEIDKLRSLPLLQAVRKLGISRWHIPRLILKTRPSMYPHMSGVSPFPGIEDMLRQLYNDGHRLFVLSSNRRGNVWAFLRAQKMDHYFTDVVSVFYGNSFYKVYGMHKVLKRWRLKREDTYYIGNETLDMHAAHRAGVKAVAVTWSGHTAADFAEYKPMAVVATPSELVDLFRSIETIQ
ncbi:MAG TPA: HAD hydrolase-like protein [Candidatus Saccharimonadales bacterium]|nr:HAD hydrolase-like protein [Candidatus Saccharimonadales bacterium]